MLVMEAYSQTLRPYFSNCCESSMVFAAPYNGDGVTDREDVGRCLRRSLHGVQCCESVRETVASFLVSP
jgi:hypothetical protein